MQAGNSPAEQDSRTFTANARRIQIVEAAIDVIATHGYPYASFAKIAKQGGLSSTGMISYHFRGKGDLTRAVVTEVMGVARQYVSSKVEGETDFSARLRSHFVANLALLDEYPKHMRALYNIVASVRADDLRDFGLTDTLAEFSEVQEERIREAQRARLIRDFDPEVMVMAIRGSIDAAIGRSAIDPDFDTAACARELADLFARATAMPTESAS